MRISSMTGLVAATLLYAAVAEGQSSPASPFQEGQWAAHVAMNGLTFGGVDVVKFTSPTRAWVASAVVNGSTTRTSGNPAFSSQTFEAFSLSLQRRFLRPAGEHAVLYVSPGIEGGYGHSCSTAPAAPSFCDRTWNAGLLAELGAEYVINRHLGVGARYRAILDYNRFDIAGNRQGSVSGSFGEAGVFGALYF